MKCVKNRTWLCRHQDRGFSLVAVMVSIAILTISALSFMNYTSFVVSYQKRLNERAVEVSYESFVRHMIYASVVSTLEKGPSDPTKSVPMLDDFVNEWHKLNPKVGPTFSSPANALTIAIIANTSNLLKDKNPDLSKLTEDIVYKCFDSLKTWVRSTSDMFRFPYCVTLQQKTGRLADVSVFAVFKLENHIGDGVYAKYTLLWVGHEMKDEIRVPVSLSAKSNRVMIPFIKN